MKLEGKTALVTGAAGGIGKAVAQNLDQAGMNLVLTDRSPEKLAELIKQLRHAIAVPGDITSPDLPGRLVAKCVSQFGSLDVVFSNAGSMISGKIQDIDVEKVCEMVRLDVESVFRLGYTVLKHFQKSNSGFLIHTSSIAGLKTAPMIGAYCGTKFAVEAFTDSLRMELAGTGIGVGCIEPGTVDTGLYATWTEEQKGTMFQGGALQPEDVARCVRFMLEQPDHMRIPRLLAVPAGQPV